jgi:hypothetical protein
MPRWRACTRVNCDRSAAVNLIQSLERWQGACRHIGVSSEEECDLKLSQAQLERAETQPASQGIRIYASHEGIREMSVAWNDFAHIFTGGEGRLVLESRSAGQSTTINKYSYVSTRHGSRLHIKPSKPTVMLQSSRATAVLPGSWPEPIHAQICV